eukprot:Rhum_TRINITY_DN14792_c14_g1::Rhum_TRINITY_DN14792_c14_g1_i1::g.117989::m.117989
MAVPTTTSTATVTTTTTATPTVVSPFPPTTTSASSAAAAAASLAAAVAQRPEDAVKRVPLPDVLPLPAGLQQAKRVSYAPALAAELEAVVKEVLELPASVDLGRLHETDSGQRQAERRASAARTGRLTAFNKKWYCRLKQNAALRETFQRVYQRFVRAVVAEDLKEWMAAAGGDGEDAPEGAGVLVFQAWPTFRCHLPGTGKNVGRRHRDYDYLHPATEVNYWIPVGCSVGGTNSLYCESAPDAADYAPFETRGAELVRFYGNACDHFTVPNESDTTRVGLDLRVIRGEDYYNAALETGHAGNPKPLQQFVVGRYYTKVRLSDPVEVGVQYALNLRLEGEEETGAAAQAGVKEGGEEEEEDERDDVQEGVTA